MSEIVKDIAKEIKYVVRFFSGKEYLYSIHCSANVLDQMVDSAKKRGYSVKILAYELDELPDVIK